MRQIWLMGRLFVLILSGWLSVCGTAWAQQAGAAKAEDAGGSYVMPYALVLLAVGLGLLIVCRSSNRRDRVKPEGYDETKVVIKD